MMINILAFVEAHYRLRLKAWIIGCLALMIPALKPAAKRLAAMAQQSEFDTVGVLALFLRDSVKDGLHELETEKHDHAKRASEAHKKGRHSCY